VATAGHGLNLPAPVLALGLIGVTAIVMSILLLLYAIRPRITGQGWFLWAELGHDDLVAHMSCDRRPDRVIEISRLVRMKYMHLRQAVDLLLCGVLLLLSVLVAAVIH
jgi:hypothetical protein